MIDNENIDNKPDICKLNIPTRIYNSLLRAGIDSIEKLTNLSEREFYNIQNIGECSAKQIVEALNDMGYKMKDEIQCNYETPRVTGIRLRHISMHIPLTDDRHITIVTIDDYKVIWRGLAKDLKDDPIIYKNWFINEIKVDYSDSTELADHEKGKIIVVYK